ncbi:MAG: hypothetical protein ACR2LQ_07035 [Acidimicrobiales bacterium]
MAEIGRVAALLAGVFLVGWALLSAIRTVILPRGEVVLLTRWTFLSVRKVFDLPLRRAKSYEQRDRAMAMFAPIGLMCLPATWISLSIAGFSAVFWGLHVDPLREAFELAGSSTLTLGTHQAPDLPTHIASFVAATLGLGLVALLISYLPSIYSAFQRREIAVTRLAARAGDPPSATEMIKRHHRLARLDALDAVWADWETWFADVEETHTSQPSLVFFRSISHERSWVTSAGVLLDAAALRASTLNLPMDAQAQITIRAGFLALRRIADYYGIAYDPDPPPDGPISIDRSEFDAAYEELASYGVPTRPDRDACWRDFRGWRVNYDTVLIALAGLTMAPYALWSSDRSSERVRSRWFPRRSRD